MGKEVQKSKWMRRWANIAWWFVTLFSVPFGIYTLPFISGKFEIYKHLTKEALMGNDHLAGLHILHNLRTWQVHHLPLKSCQNPNLLQFYPGMLQF
jgi:hypothetical protein